MIIAISLIWIRHKVAGGVESFTRNLLDGFIKDESPNSYILLCSKDNIQSFSHYEADDRFVLYECPVTTSDLKGTLLFENFKLDKLVSSLKADLCFIPCYRMPLLWNNNKYVVVIHDLISCHFPQIFSASRRHWLTFASKRASRCADRVVAISNFVRKDIIDRFRVNVDNVYTIYNPILPSREVGPFSPLMGKYGISRNHYFYTVSSLATNKNLMTLLKLMKELKEHDQFKNYKLLISGVGLSASAKSKFNFQPYHDYLVENNLESSCIFTGFVSNEERNTLIQNSAYFLFASVFEGFGMPVIEAIELGAKVLTTRCASIPEVSKEKAYYVNNPYDIKEWKSQLEAHANETSRPIHFIEYEVGNVVNQYLMLFNEVVNAR